MEISSSIALSFDDYNYITLRNYGTHIRGATRDVVVLHNYIPGSNLLFCGYDRGNYGVIYDDINYDVIDKVSMRNSGPRWSL
jgi:hypothetical protein